MKLVTRQAMYRFSGIMGFFSGIFWCSLSLSLSLFDRCQWLLPFAPSPSIGQLICNITCRLAAASPSSAGKTCPGIASSRLRRLVVELYHGIKSWGHSLVQHLVQEIIIQQLHRQIVRPLDSKEISYAPSPLLHFLELFGALHWVSSFFYRPLFDH